jgi:hypothetical protein
VGTNAATGVVVGIGGLIGHLAGGVDWNLLDDQALLKTIAAILVVAGISLGIQAALGEIRTASNSLPATPSI